MRNAPKLTNYHLLVSAMFIAFALDAWTQTSISNLDSPQSAMHASSASATEPSEEFALRASSATGASASSSSPVPSSSPAAAPALPVRREAKDVLLLHGINLDTASILAFLAKGFTEQAVTRGLPLNPRQKTQVVSDAIQELGAQRASAAVGPLMAICRREFPFGARMALRMDMEGIEATNVREERARLEGVLALNAMVALGWIGDPQALPAIQAAMTREKETGFTTQGALALGMLGDASGVAPVLNLMKTGAPAEQAGAARAFYYLVGRYYPLGLNTSVQRRKQMMKDIEQWRKDEEKNFEVSGAEVRRRRLGDYPPNPKPPDMASVRGLCAAAASIASNYNTSFGARIELQRRGEGALPDLEVVARDPLEDLDVRREAIRAYIRAAGKKSEDLLDDLDGDENPTIADLAKQSLKTLQQIP